MPRTNLRMKTHSLVMSVMKLHTLLTLRLKDTSIDASKLLKVLEDEDINGEVFLHMTTQDMQDIFGSHLKCTFYIRKILLKTQEELSKKNMKYESDDTAKEYQETFRKFGQPTMKTDVYKKGGILTSTVCRLYNLIDPIHKCMVPPIHNQEQWLGRETVKFAAACLNSRINGTIHFCIEASDDRDECKGEKIGIMVSNVENVRKEISAALDKRFIEKQLVMIRKCIFAPQFVPVVEEDKKSSLYVVEVDVEPSSLHRKTELFAVMFPPYGPSKRSVFAYDSSLIQLDSDMENQLQDELKSLAETRKQRKEIAYSNMSRESDCGTRLQRLVTRGNRHIADELFPILFVGPLASHMDRRFLEENLDFIVHMLGSLKAVFQFDGGDHLYQFVESTGENTCLSLEPEDFNRHKIDYVKEKIASGNKTPWIFCNGCKHSQVMEIVQWNRERREGVQEAIRLFSHEFIPEGRAVVIFLLFEKIDDPMLKAADEIFLKIKNQWVLLAENSGVAEKWMTALCRRKQVQKREIAQRFIVGLQWHNVNEIMKAVINDAKIETSYLPASYGECTMTAKENIEKELDDLEILSCRQFQEERSRMSTDDQITKRKDSEEQFYRGSIVSWWNFVFNDQVCERKIFPKLLDNIKSKLKKEASDGDKLVLTETLRHHAGAGGSTLGRHCLWHLSQIRLDADEMKYRCCVIKKISDETASQIEKFRRFKDDKANKPVIALLDNESDKKINMLHEQLLYLANKSENAGGLFCMLLIVKRSSISAQEKVIVKTASNSDQKEEPLSNDSVMTRELSQDEIAWFGMKTEYLENNARNLGSGQIELENLIAFNLMKHQFNKSYIRKFAERFYEDIHDNTEKYFLKCLAFINLYDMLFQPVPSSVFDQMMTPLPTGGDFSELQVESLAMGSKVPRQKRFVPCEEESTWNVKISKVLQTVLIKKSPEGQGYTTGGLSIISQDLANELLEQIMTHSRQSLDNVALAVLEVVKQHVCEKNLSSRSFVGIVNSLFKNRWWSEDGHRRQFSELVLALNDSVTDGCEKTIKVMEKCFDYTEDHMVAQQLARFQYLKCKNWKAAKAVIKKAIEKKESSYLLDTYGKILKNEMEQINTFDEVEELFKLAYDAMDKFKKGQKVCRESEEEDINSTLYGEINTGLDLVDKFQKLASEIGEEEFHRFLVDQNYIPQTFQSLDQTNLCYLKKQKLYEDLNNTLRVLEDKVDQVIGQHFTSTAFQLSGDRLADLRQRLEKYYSTKESSTVTPYVYGYGLGQIMKLRETDPEILLQRYNKARLALNSLAKNPESECQDLLIALGRTLASLSYESNYSESPGIDYHELLNWSERLYNLSHSVTRPYMEAYLYFVIFHFPTKARRDLPHCHLDILNTALDDMKATYRRNHNVQSQKEKKENFQRCIPPQTFFFLGKGDPGHDIVHYKRIYGKTQPRGDELWGTPEAKKKATEA